MTEGHYEGFASTKGDGGNSFLPMARQKSRVTYKRADRPEQKDERRQLILKAAAAELTVISSAKDFTISALARRAGLAKGTVYLYFDNKSAILMALLGDAIEKMLTDVVARINKLSEPVDAPKVAGAIRDSLKNSATSQRLIRLLKSLSEDSGRAHEEFRQRINPLIEQADTVIVERLPALRPGEGQRIMRYSWALFFGLSEMEEKPHKPQRGPKKCAPMSVEESLGEAMTLLIEGYLARKV
jgi:AcrR family transcriptional regulator